MNHVITGRTSMVWVAAATLLLAILVPVHRAEAGPSDSPASETKAQAPRSPRAGAAAPATALETDLESAKQKTLELDRELSRLEHELLFPATTRFAVYIALDDAAGDSGAGHALRSVQLKLDDRVISTHIYSAEELAALRAGGIQQAYVGNVAPGKHRLVASVTAAGPNGDRHVETPIAFEKGSDPQYVQLRVSTRTDKPHLLIRALVKH